MRDDALVRAAQQLAAADAPLSGDAAPERAWLVDAVRQLLDANPALLLSALYRVDVREGDVRAALSLPDPAPALADALIAREAEKRRYRHPYAHDR